MHRFLVLIARGVLATLVLVGLLVVVSPGAQTAPQAPQVTWAPSQVALSMSPGDTTTVQIIATASSNVPATTAQIVSRMGLGSYVSIQPQNVPPLPAGAHQIFTLSFTVPSGTAFQTLAGAVRLRATRKTVPVGLPVSLEICNCVVADEIAFTYPTEILDNGGVVEQPLVEPQAPGVTYIGVPISVGADPATNAFTFLLHENPGLLTLEQWFAANVDPDGELLAAGTFAKETFPDGKVAFVSTAVPVPPTFAGPPVSYAYALSPASDKVAIIALGHDNDLHRLGYPTAADREVVLREIMETLSFDTP